MENIKILNEVLESLEDMKVTLLEIKFDDFKLKSHNSFSIERINMLTSHIKDTIAIAIATEQINSQEKGK